MQRLQKHVDDLGEHFDTVQIFVTRYPSESGGTVHARLGSGNYYARIGQVKEWIITEDAIARNEVEKNKEDEE